MRSRGSILLRASVLAATALLVAACGYSDPYAHQGAEVGTNVGTSPSPSAQSCLQHPGVAAVHFPDGLQQIDLTTGTGATVKPGDTVNVFYSGWLASNCSLFDASSLHGGTPTSFALTSGSVIQGWVEGIPGMRTGGKRKLIIPGSLGYGAQGNPPAIPANATLVFDITLVSTGPTPSPSPSPGASPTPKPTPT